MARGWQLVGLGVCLAWWGSAAYAAEPRYIDYCAPEYVAPESLSEAERDKAGWYFDLVLVDAEGNPVAADGEFVLEIYEEEADTNPRRRLVAKRSFKVRKHDFRPHRTLVIGKHRHPLHFHAGPILLPPRPHAGRIVVQPGFVVAPHGHVIHGRKGAAVIVIPVR